MNYLENNEASLNLPGSLNIRLKIRPTKLRNWRQIGQGVPEL